MKRFIVTKNDDSTTLDTSYESSNNYSTSVSYNTSTDESQYEYTESEYTESELNESELNESEYTESEYTENETKRIKLKNINSKLNNTGNIDDEYKRLGSLSKKNTTVKKVLTKEQIIKRLEGCISLNTIEEMEILNTLPLRRIWIWYMHKDTKSFKVGGFLMKVSYPDYIVLVNYRNKITWSVQLKENILFIKNTEEMEKLNKAYKIKQKLYKLYNEGKLLLKDV